MSEDDGWVPMSNGTSTGPNPRDLSVELDPGSDLSRAFEGITAALRAETARLMASQKETAERQTSELLDQARRQADDMLERAARQQETARAALAASADRYAGLLRVLGQLSGGLEQIREQATAEAQAIQRMIIDTSRDRDGHPAADPQMPESRDRF